MPSLKIQRNSDEDIFEKILTDQVVRKHTVQNSFEFFFPIYFHQYMEYETAPFHEEMFRILEDEQI